jgi:hypothetical protein
MSRKPSPAPIAPKPEEALPIGAHLPRKPCRDTLDLFAPRTLDLFTDHKAK